MVELVLVFLLGVLSAGLVWLLLLPLVWRRAERLTRERIERALPLNTNEILAERDRERAAFAVQRLALEDRMNAMRDQVRAAKGEVGQMIASEAGLRAEISALENELAALRQALASREAEIASLKEDLALSHEGLIRLEEERFALSARLAVALDRVAADTSYQPT